MKSTIVSDYIRFFGNSVPEGIGSLGSTPPNPKEPMYIY
jgi:hypothetical protein